jgi:hypothetical protein
VAAIARAAHAGEDRLRAARDQRLDVGVGIEVEAKLDKIDARVGLLVGPKERVDDDAVQGWLAVPSAAGSS